MTESACLLSACGLYCFLLLAASLFTGYSYKDNTVMSEMKSCCFNVPIATPLSVLCRASMLYSALNILLPLAVIIWLFRRSANMFQVSVCLLVWLCVSVCVLLYVCVCVCARACACVCVHRYVSTPGVSTSTALTPPPQPRPPTKYVFCS